MRKLFLKKQDLWMKGTNKHMEVFVIGRNKYMSTHSKDSTMRQFQIRVIRERTGRSEARRGQRVSFFTTIFSVCSRTFILF